MLSTIFQVLTASVITIHLVSGTNTAEQYGFSCMTGDATATKLVAGTTASHSTFKTSSDSGVTWKNVTGAEMACTDMASDTTGQYVYACDLNNAAMHISTDYGETWVDISPNETSCTSIATNEDGMLVAGVFRNVVWLSTDRGQNWEESPGSPTMEWYSNEKIQDIAMDESGEYVGICTDKFVYSSTDYGATFKPSTTLNHIDGFTSIATDAKADHIYVTYNSGYGGVAVSIDKGYQFSYPESMPVNYSGWFDSMSDVTGQHVMAISRNVYGDTIVTSSDYGVSWEESNLPVRSEGGGWGSMVMSDDHATVVAAVEYNQPFVSHDQGLHFTTTQSPFGYWNSATFVDGPVLYALSGGLYSSTDNGETWWFMQTPGGSNIAACSSGQHITLSAYGSEDPHGSGCVYTSSDFGVTWIEPTLTLAADDTSFNGGPVAVSGDGRFQLLCPSNYGYLYLSSDFGVSFQQTGSVETYYSRVAMDGSGQYMMATVQAGVSSIPFRSEDFGRTWVELNVDVSASFTVAISESGQHHYFGTITENTYFYHSTDYGVSWTNQTLDDKYTSVSISDDGATLVVSKQGKLLYSTDFGTSWTCNSLPDDVAFQPYSAVTIDATGTLMSSWGYRLTMIVSEDMGATWDYV